MSCRLRWVNTLLCYTAHARCIIRHLPRLPRMRAQIRAPGCFLHLTEAACLLCLASGPFAEADRPAAVR